MEEPMDTDNALWEAAANAKHDQKWDILKSKIEELYMQEGLDLADVQEEMKARYGLIANDSHYKYRFRKWGWKRSMTSKQKVKALKEIQTRADAGKSSSVILYGKEVDKQKLRRYLKDIRRHDAASSAKNVAMQDQNSQPLLAQSQVFGNGLFINWNLPYQIVLAQHIRQADSPASTTLSPSNLQVVTPQSNNSHNNADVASPLTVLRNERNEQQALQNAHLLLEGQYPALVKSLTKSEAKVTLKWMNQFWMFAYKTAKSWGRGPYVWTAADLDLTIRDFSSPADTGVASDSPLSHQERSPRRALLGRTVPMPSSLCRWSIHCSPDAVVYEDEDGSSQTSNDLEPSYQDPQDERTWKEWPDAWQQPEFSERLVQGLHTNNFSTVSAQELPMTLSQPLNAALQAGSTLLEESLGFAICGCNVELVKELLVEMRNKKVKPSRTYPLHLATSYLQGSKSCCLIFESLARASDDWGMLDSRNELGHSPLDNLFITILRSHTNLLPEEVDPRFRGEKRFPGEEIDICGRWDADSECYRQLLSSGAAAIPFEWKHKSCHTSTQTVCHTITALSFTSMRETSQLSGLFSKRCEICGCKMELSPLHVAVLTAVFLAERGCKDEDLFGILAVILCLIRLNNRYSNIRSAPDYVSLGMIFVNDKNGEDNGVCQHYPMNAGEFAESLPKTVTQRWNKSAMIGWQVICHMLRISITETQRLNDFGNNIPEEEFCDEHQFPTSLHPIYKLWSTAEVELLTYRQLHESDPWVSGNFDMEAVLRSLEVEGSGISAGRITDVPLMKDLCECGMVRDAMVSFPIAEDVSTKYFSNMGNDYERCTIIPPTQDTLGL